MIAVLATGSAFGQLMPSPSYPASAPAADAPIGSRDILEIRVFQDPSLNSRAVVGDDGRITLPLLGKVDVAGLTAQQAEARLRTLLEKYLAHPDVTVIISEVGSKPISVIGSVVRPGHITATGNISLLQALTQAGGVAPGYGGVLYVLRTGANGLTEQVSIDVEDLLVNGNPDLNIPLMPNDVVNVPVDVPLNIYVLGEVMRPGKVQFKRSQSPTLLQALSEAGGLTDRASKNVLVKRTVNGVETALRFNYKQILGGKMADVLLQDNDRIIIAESLF